MSDTNNTKKITCPECENEFEHDFSDVEIGDIIECPVCGTNLEIVELDPIHVESVILHK